MKRRTWSERLFDWVNQSALVLIAFIMLFPFLYVFAVSFSSYKEFLRNEFMLWPKEWVASAYTFILGSKPFVRSLYVTGYITVLGTLTNLAFTSTFAYALSRPAIGRRVVLFMVLFTLLFSAGMIPTYLVVRATGLMNSIWALILPIAINPFNLIVMRQFFLGIPNEVIESGIMDGANEFQIFRRIILPLSKPALAAFGLFYAVGHWNAYFSGILYLNDPRKWPVQVILRQIVVVNEPLNTLRENGQTLQEMPPPETVQMAAILLATLPILIVYPFLQKHFSKGVMLGAVKG